MEKSTRSILWIWALSTVIGIGAHLLLRQRFGREIAVGIGFFIYAAVAWPGFRILARRNGHGLSPVLYFSASGLAAVAMAMV